MNRIEVDIRELRVVGFTERNPEALRDGLRTELVRLLAVNGIPDTWRGGSHVDRISGSLPKGQTAGAALGRAAATSIYEGKER